MAGYNKITRSVNPKSVFESAQSLVDATISWNQGDLLYLDSTAHLLKPVTAETQSADFMGVARQTIVLGKVASPYNTDVVASQAISDIAGPQTGVVAKVILKTGDTIAPGQVVGLDPASGFRNVSVTVTTVPVGVYQGPAITTAPAGTEIEVYFGFALISGTRVG